MDLEILKAQFPDGITAAFRDKGQSVVQAKPSHLYDLLKFCKDDPQCHFNILMDVIAVDFLGQTPRFEVVYILYSLIHHHRIRIKVRVEDGESLPTASRLWASADWAEREVWDMMGIPFRGHPNLKRILLFEGFEGHPLRKDYPINKRQEVPLIEEIP
jgi:NADH-quinone oxidoreductase subunit C